MNILQSVLALSFCVLARAEVKRELGFTGIGSYHGIVDAPAFRYGGNGNGHTLISHGKLNGATSNGLFHISNSGFGKGVVGHNSLANFGGFGHNSFPSGHQGYGSFNLNNGYHNALFTPVLLQPTKAIALEHGWKGIESGHGSIKEGLAIASAAFGDGHHKTVIPVHENTHEIAPAPVAQNVGKLHGGFAGFKQNNFGTYGGHGSFGTGGQKGYALVGHESVGLGFGQGNGHVGSAGSAHAGHGAASSFGQIKSQGLRYSSGPSSNNVGAHKTLVYSGYHGNQGGFAQGVGHSVKSHSPNAYSAHFGSSLGGSTHGSVGTSFGGQGSQHSTGHHSVGAINSLGHGHNINHLPAITSFSHSGHGSKYVSSTHGAASDSGVSAHGVSGHGTSGQGVAGHGLASHGSSGHISSGLSAHVSSGLSAHGSSGHASTSHGSSIHGSSGHGASDHGSVGHGSTGHGSSGHGSVSYGHSIAAGHGTNGHGSGHHDKATSFQSFVIHSYKPVPVYAKKNEHKHEATEHHDGSQAQAGHSQTHHY